MERDISWIFRRRWPNLCWENSSKVYEKQLHLLRTLSFYRKPSMVFWCTIFHSSFLFWYCGLNVSLQESYNRNLMIKYLEVESLRGIRVKWGCEDRAPQWRSKEFLRIGQKTSVCSLCLTLQWCPLSYYEQRRDHFCVLSSCSWTLQLLNHELNKLLLTIVCFSVTFGVASSSDPKTIKKKCTCLLFSICSKIVTVLHYNKKCNLSWQYC